MVVRYIRDRVGVIYLGKLAEVGETERCLPQVGVHEVHSFDRDP
jgi:ABC-type oligopeptide transport system ATPase subunit